MSITSGQLVLTHALRHAWAAGDLSDGAVHELSLAAGLVHEHAVTPAAAVDLCEHSLRVTRDCDLYSCSGATVRAWPSGIAHCPSCDAGEFFGDRYVTRFGDVCCETCHAPLFWVAEYVRDGIYGDGTAAWIAATLARHTGA